MKLKFTALPIYLLLNLLPANNAIAATQPSWSSPEHTIIGDIHLESITPEGTLHLPNGLVLTYGEILSLPDFYGTPKPISLGETEEERRKLFMDSFNSLAVNPDSYTEAKKILALIEEENDAILDGMQNGDSAEQVYNKIGHQYDIKYNCITGGGCAEDTWWLYPGRYLALANENYDHFGDNAIAVYKIGHQLAQEQAVLASETKDRQGLELAYAINAFACHFLSDRFAAGHIRTPRNELSKYTSPATLGSLLAEYMHNEENASGLHVHNVNGDHWVAYGDKSLFNPKTDVHRTILAMAVQLSSHAVFKAYQLGAVQTKDDAFNLIPMPDEGTANSNLDVSPMFEWDANSNQLLRRSDLSNLHDKNWTNSWWGWTTLMTLREVYGASNIKISSENHKLGAVLPSNTQPAGKQTLVRTNNH